MPRGRGGSEKGGLLVQKRRQEAHLPTIQLYKPDQHKNCLSKIT